MRQALRVGARALVSASLLVSVVACTCVDRSPPPPPPPPPAPPPPPPDGMGKGSSFADNAIAIRDLHSGAVYRVALR